MSWLFLTKFVCRTYHDLVSMLNHPGCLKLKKGGRGSKLQLKQNGEKWLVVDGIKDSEYRNLEHIRNSPKFILAVHGIAKATELGEKVLISSKCLRTLDMLEHFLSSTDWKSPVGSLRDSFPHLKLGGWKKGKDYVRIDGGVDSGRRGTIIEDFNKETSKTKVFLISSEAGGIGINLVSAFRRILVLIFCAIVFYASQMSHGVPQCSASVVFILDNHFNPSVSQQCLARVHRYGQTKPVRCYRFAIENSLEAKVYARSENKVSVSKSVLDGFFSEGIFSKGELENFYASDITETCDKCGKIRILLETQFPSEDDEDWFCAMNQDTKHNSCDIPEEPRAKRVTKRVEKHVDGTADALTTYLLSVHNKATHKKDPIVSSILPVEVKHETGICCNDAIQKLEQELGLEAAFDESEREGNQALSSNKIDTSATPQQDHAKPASINAKKRKMSPEIIVID
jgi:CW-type Zinc Finger